MSRLSPGPWHWRRRAASPDLRDVTGATILDAEYEDIDDEGAADARLIAAAPELLELLRRAHFGRTQDELDAEALLARIDGTVPDSSTCGPRGIPPFWEYRCHCGHGDDVTRCPKYAATRAAVEEKGGGTMTKTPDGTVLKTGTHGRYSWRAVSFIGGEAVEAIFDLPDGRCMWRHAYQVRGFGPSLNDTVVDLIMELALRQFDSTGAV